MSTRMWVYAGLALAGVGVARLLSRGGPKVTKESRVLVLGDSLAVGLGPLIRVLGRDEGITVDHLAKSGSRAQEWAQSPALALKLGQYRPTLVLVSLGTNDTYAGNAIQTQLPWAQRLAKLLRDAGAEVAWIGPPALPNPHGGMRADEAYLRALRGGGVVPDPAYFHSEAMEIPRAPDNLHPSVRGYAGWAAKAWAWLH